MKEKTNQENGNKNVPKLPLTSDIVFKRVFSKKGNESILKALLEAILDIKINKVTVQNPELPKNLYDSKAGVLDVKVEIDQDTICDVEMQVKDKKNIDKRSTHYLAKILSDELKVSQDYKLIKKAIVINLLNFEFYKRNSYHSVAHMNFEETKPEEYVNMGYPVEDKMATTDLEMHFIELPKFIKKNPEATTDLEQWLWLIAGKEEKIEMAKNENEEIKKAVDIIDQMSMSKEEWEMYESRRIAIMDYNTGIHQAREEGIEEGRKEGRKEGKKEGIKEGKKAGLEEGKKAEKIKVTQELLKLGMEIEQIEKVTQLTKEEIEDIKKDIIRQK